jgi:hypothetical protein
MTHQIACVDLIVSPLQICTLKICVEDLARGIEVLCHQTRNTRKIERDACQKTNGRDAQLSFSNHNGKQHAHLLKKKTA